VFLRRLITDKHRVCPLKIKSDSVITATTWLWRAWCRRKSSWRALLLCTRSCAERRCQRGIMWQTLVAPLLIRSSVCLSTKTTSHTRECVSAIFASVGTQLKRDRTPREHSASLTEFAILAMSRLSAYPCTQADKAEQLSISETTPGRLEEPLE
jgi:hypothetical protein